MASGRVIGGDLAGRVALVTGSSAGIGRAIAEALAARGAAVVVHGIDPAQNAAVLAEWRDCGWQAMGCDADLAAPDGATRLVDAVEAQLGQVDILVLNASIEIPQLLTDLTIEAMTAQSSVNLMANIALLQHCLPAMRARGWGRVVAIGSVQEERPNARHLFYAGIKAALTNMVLNLARHDAGPVTLNVVRPGAVRTHRNQGVLDDPAFARALLERIPLDRVGEPQDCAGAVSLLCSEAGSYINGAVIAIDGGLRL